MWRHFRRHFASVGGRGGVKIFFVRAQKIMARVPWCRLKNGLEIRRIINGMWQVSGNHGPIDSNKASRAMFKYFDAGLTTFDMADIYGPAEEIFGDFVEQLKAERGEESAGKVQGELSIILTYVFKVWKTNWKAVHFEVCGSFSKSTKLN